jgi:metal-responsive CopG/Arc/MetJ family transcriptional regulator
MSNKTNKTNKTTMTVSINKELFEQLKEIVKMEGFNRSRLVEKMIDDFINNYKNKNNE